MSDTRSDYTTLWFFLVCFVCSICFAGLILSPFFSIIILASVIAGIFFPIYNFFCNKCRLLDTVSSFITCLLIFLILFLPTAFFIGIVVQEVLELVQLARSTELTNLLNIFWKESFILERINSFLSNFSIVISEYELNLTLSKIGRAIGLFLYEQVRLVASNTLSLVINALLMLLIIFFLLLDGKKLVKFIIDLSPLPKEQDEKLIGKFNDMSGAILIGNGLCGIVQGFLGGIIFWCFGLHSALLWGIVMAFLAFLPIIGIGFVLLPTVMYFLLKGRLIAGLFIFVFYILVSTGIEYILKPKVVGHRVKMHTLMVFLSFLGGLKIFGILGIIYGPLIITAFLTLTDIYRTDYRILD